eukprot:1737504-Lingulodinium_polyedra.AAC.1
MCHVPRHVSVPLLCRGATPQLTIGPLLVHQVRAKECGGGHVVSLDIPARYMLFSVSAFSAEK